MRRLAYLVGLMAAASLGLAQSANIRLYPFPTVSVADGRSTVTISAEVRDTSGRLVPDGTRVVFTTDAGQFREPVASTTSGVARCVLVAPRAAGVAHISANAISYQATSTLDFEFVGDRAMLSSATEYIEVVAPKDLSYSMDYRILAASGTGRQAVLLFRDIEVRADDLQLNVPATEVKARNALLKIGKDEYEFGELLFNLSNRKGYGLTKFKAERFEPVPAGGWFKFRAMPDREVYGIREVTAQGIKQPANEVARSVFGFADIAGSTSMIGAKKAVAYPRKEIQFHKAEVYVAGARVLKLPLFQIPVYGQNRVVMDDIVNVNNNQIAINYPYYLSLKPGQTSLLRFHTGQQYGRGLNANRGIFLDYELNWSKGDDMQGEFVVSGIGRDDWGVSARQYLRIDDTTSASAQIELPSHQSVFGQMAFSKQLGRYQLNLSGSANRSLYGAPVTGQQLTFGLDSEPVPLGRLPISMSYGLTANHNRLDGGGYSSVQSNAGLGTRFFTPLLYLDRSTTLSADLSLSKLFGTNTSGGLSVLGSASLSKSFSRDAFVMLTYNFLDDGFASQYTGRHMLGVRSNLNLGSLSLRGMVTRGLDVDRTSFYADASLRLMRDMRLSYSYTHEQFFGQGFLDYNFVLAYRFGFREFGLTWSHRTNRLGFQFLGTTMY